MSREAIIQMLGQADKESGLQQELRAAMEGQADMAGSFVAAAAKHGFEFTAEELRNVLAETDGEISDEKLSQIAGGASGVPGLPVMSSSTLNWASQINNVLKASWK